MKKNLSKVIVPTIAISIGAALAGSISGTVAWYQYSTRANVAYIGTSVGLSQHLEVCIKDTTDQQTFGGWKSALTHENIKDYLKTQLVRTGVYMGDAVQPITSGDMKETDALPTYNAGTQAAPNIVPQFFKNPIRAYTASAPYAGWLKADASMYVQIPLQIRYASLDNVKVHDVDVEYLEKEVFLSDLLIQEDYQNSGHQDPEDDRKDLSSAIRVHIHSYRDDDTNSTDVIDRLISKNGGTTQTNGHLDVDGDGYADAIKTGQSGAEYGFGDSASYESTPIVYGEGAQVSFSANKTVLEGQTMYDSEGNAIENASEDIYPMVCASKANSALLDEDNMKYDKGTTADFSKSLGHTIASESGGENEGKYLNVVITIWVEGWNLLPAPTPQDANAKSAMWKAADYIGSMFDVGFQFAVQAE